tara:strand:+ start:1270 stop:1785 length:516 start_codon:yes stop_codon:yes gene_type:complete
MDESGTLLTDNINELSVINRRNQMQRRRANRTINRTRRGSSRRSAAFRRSSARRSRVSASRTRNRARVHRPGHNGYNNGNRTDCDAIGVTCPNGECARSYGLCGKMPRDPQPHMGTGDGNYYGGTTYFGNRSGMRNNRNNASGGFRKRNVATKQQLNSRRVRHTMFGTNIS